MQTDEQETALRYLGKIPVHNMLWLYLYALDMFRQMDREERSRAEEYPDDIAALIAGILTHAVERRMRRNLNSDFLHRSADLHRVRGRINFLRTERRQLLARGMIACEFEELSVNTPRNRYVREALVVMGNVVKDDSLAVYCHELATMMERLGVHGARPSRHEVMSAHSSYHDPADERMLFAARFALEVFLPSPAEGGDMAIHRPDDPEEAWRLFQDAVAGFYDASLSGDNRWKVDNQRKFKWPIEGEKSPLMPTYIVPDIFIEGVDRHIVIDTKFREATATSKHRGERLYSDHLYQIYTYLRIQEDFFANAGHATGILLYPQIGNEELNEVNAVHGHKVCVYTVDLRARPTEISRRLLEIIGVDREPWTSQGPQV